MQNSWAVFFPKIIFIILLTTGCDSLVSDEKRIPVNHTELQESKLKLSDKEDITLRLKEIFYPSIENRDSLEAEESAYLDDKYKQIELSATEQDINELDLEGEGLDTLIEIIKTNLDPGIRSLALERLSNTESYIAIETTILALNDDSVEVVLQALDTIEFIGDDSVIRYIEKLLYHPSTEVREAARKTIDFLD